MDSAVLRAFSVRTTLGTAPEPLRAWLVEHVGMPLGDPRHLPVYDLGAGFLARPTSITWEAAGSVEVGFTEAIDLLDAMGSAAERLQANPPAPLRLPGVGAARG